MNTISIQQLRPVGVKDNTYIDFKKEVSDKDPSW